VLATGVTAHPKIPNAIRNTPNSVPFSKQINVTGDLSPVHKDLIRLKNIGHDIVKGVHHIVNDVHHILKGDHRFNASTSHAREENPAPELGLSDVVMGYVAKVGVGNPPTYCESCRFLQVVVSYMPVLDSLMVDTGRAVTWVGANTPYQKTNTSVSNFEVVVSILLCSDCWTSSNMDQIEGSGTVFVYGNFTS
jgi:hypothetical protein